MYIACICVLYLHGGVPEVHVEVCTGASTWFQSGSPSVSWTSD